MQTLWTRYGSIFSRNILLRNGGSSSLTMATLILNGSAPMHMQNSMTCIAGNANWNNNKLKENSAKFSIRECNTAFNIYCS
jgi:hypothetical protein